MRRRVSRKACVALLAAALAAGAGSGLNAQITDPTTGNITTGNWLILGPFSNFFGCTGIAGDQLTLHLAPSSIHCLAPEEGQEVDYDPALASTDGYTGPVGGTGKPVWRIFDDGTPDGDQNFDLDTALGGDQTDKMVYIATYVEYLGASPIDIEICAGSDDGVQVWVDRQLAHNNPACRGVGDCQDRVPYTMTPGLHRIAMGVWERAGGFGGRLALHIAGVPILEDNPDFVFHGIENPGVDLTCDGLFQRTTASPSNPDACPPVSGGPLTVTIAGIGIPAGGNLAVNERATGSFGAPQITIPGGAVAPTSITSIAQPPIDSSFLPDFQDGRVLTVQPNCPGGNGEIIDNGDGSFTLSNVGEDIWQTGDSFTFLYNRVQGDFVMTAHVAERSAAPSQWGKHGLMARQDLLTRSRYSFIHDQQDPVNPADVDNVDQTRFAARPTHQGADNFESTVLAASEHHDYLRIERVGNVVIGSSSLDGLTWVEQGRLDWGVTAPPNMLVGLAVTSHSFNCDDPITITFDEISLTGTVAPLSLADYPIGVDINWASVPRADLNAANVSYTINIPVGQANFVGSAGAEPVLGAGSGVLPAPVTDLGGSLSQFDHGHNIGAPCPGTNITEPSPGTYLIEGAGNDIWQDGDQFMFAYNTVSGDFSARVTIVNREHPPVAASRWGKHGIMARQDCNIRSRYSFVHDHGADLQDTTRFATRPTHGGRDNFEITPAANCDRGIDPACNHANTLRLDRCGNEFISYVIDETGAFGGDPGAWVEIGRYDWGPDAPASVEVGLAVTTHNSAGSCNITTITFEDWQLLPACDAPVGNLSCVENAGGLDITWTNPPSANTGVAIQVNVNDVPFTTVPGTATSVSIPGSAFPAGQISSVDIINSSTVAATCGFPPYVNPAGFVKNWLILGPLVRPGGASPGDDQIVLDFLTDGSTTELDIRPSAGDSITPDYNNLASSTSLAQTPGRPDINPGGTPTWFEWIDPDDTVDYFDVFNQDLNDNMVYAVTYVKVDAETVVDIGVGSDDSYHVLVNGVTPAIGGFQNVARGWGVANEVQSIVEDVVLEPGCNIIMIKVFEGGGGHGFRLRFQDDLGNPIIPGPIFTNPECSGGGGGTGFRRGDSNASGDLNITDGVFVLNYLFLGGPEPPCQDAADSDDNGQLNITDGVRILNYLFLGGPAPPAPGPDSCGPDPTSDDDLPTCVYTAC
jgi:hypothetical protein